MKGRKNRETGDKKMSSMTDNNGLKGVFKGEEKVYDTTPHIACPFHRERAS